VGTPNSDAPDLAARRDPTRELLRLEVGRLRRRESRRRFDTVVSIGWLDGVRHSRAVPAAAGPLLDPGTRSEVVARLLEELTVAADDRQQVDAWLERPGEPVLEDEDLRWLSSASRAFEASGMELDRFWAVTRTGWLDVRTEERRTWKRLRL